MRGGGGGVQVPTMVAGGALWFPDLTAADPTYALPVLCSLSFLATVEVGAADGMQGQPPEMLQRMKTLFRVLSVAMVPITANMPVVSTTSRTSLLWDALLCTAVMYAVPCFKRRSLPYGI